jgi:hypothetical protein
VPRFWQVKQDGGFIKDAVAVIDTSRATQAAVFWSMPVASDPGSVVT